jgi:hypothetical protein
MVVEAVGGGLIAAGGAILLASLRGATDHASVAAVEADRRERNARVAAVTSAVSTLSGAVLVLAAAAPLWPIPAAAGAFGAYYLALAWATRREYARLARYIGGQLDSEGYVVLSIAPYLDLGNWDPQDANLALMHKSSMPGEMAAEARRRALERSRWRWALQHPFGARDHGL